MAPPILEELALQDGSVFGGQVKNLPKGVTLTLTNENADVAVRLQKMGEAMRLMHDAHAR
jgi:hypothetical protein